MGFLDPKQQEDDDSLGGLSGLHLDLDVKICPACRREALPWEDTCPDCGVATVAPSDLPAASFPLPHLEADQPAAADLDPNHLDAADLDPDTAERGDDA